MSPYDRESLSTGRSEIKKWYHKHPSGSIFIIVEGHAVINSGEVLWLNSIQKEEFGYIPTVCLYSQFEIESDKECQIVMKVLSPQIFEMILTENRCGFRGMLALVCGYAYHEEKSRKVIQNLIEK
jgi:hypothetical protein